MNKLRIVILLCITFSFQSYAQPEDVSTYFNDDGISNSKNIIKIGVLGLVRGDAHILYERILNKGLGVEIGFGIMMPYYVPEFSEAFDQSQIVRQPDGGTTSKRAQLRFYLARDAPEGTFSIIDYRNQRYKFDNGESEATYTYYGLGYGKSRSIDSRLFMEYSATASARLSEVKGKATFGFGGPIKETDFSIIFAFKLGYRL